MPVKLTSPLTKREWQILAGVAGGLKNREIAEQLNVSPHTVASHLERVYYKLNVRNRAAAAAYFARHGRGWMFEGDLVVR